MLRIVNFSSALMWVSIAVVWGVRAYNGTPIDGLSLIVATSSAAYVAVDCFVRALKS